ncbi:PTS sugar transporter subunit IIB [Thermoactinomyces sp. CICC 10521]|uniref:PTS sugar transporter subunit IIB n=1 Tax=Thermoactinomyces sp. CICC 10521 TaxID=2767426 RepID=UPI0018DD8304|nr:PTS sugar transporter subunit IIB [Thermoactinomyces sp. CICC 10521]MBH8606846.1 PTS sugar transporter subunit IIB [Thermoactinomyces sp. CICC 10521]
MNHAIRLMIVCSLGASSGALCRKINEAARKRGLELIAESTSALRWAEQLSRADVILYEPQISHLKTEMAKIADEEGIPLAMVDPVAFATMSGEKVLDQVLTLIKR